MSSLKQKAFKMCIKWDSIGKTCLEEKYAVWLEDAEQTLTDLKQKAIELYRYYYDKKEREYGCFALGELFDVNVLDEWNEPIEPEKFEELLKEAKSTLVKGKIIMICPKCGEHAPNLTNEGCPKCGFKPEVKKAKT
jgi:hypothetical protein